MGRSWLERQLTKAGDATGINKLSDYVNPFDSDFQRKVGNLWDDVTGVTAADKAAAAQREGLNKAQDWQERMYDKAMEAQRPWLEAGGRGLASLEAGLDSGQFDVDPGQYQAGAYQGPGEFQEMQFDFEADPGYQFRLSEGMRAIEGSAAARGGLFSGATGRAIQDYGQGLASQEYGNAYNRFADQRDYARGNYESDRGFGRSEFESDRNFGYGSFMDDFNRERAMKTDQYNRLAALSGTGQITSGNVGSQAIAQGGNLANIELMRGNVGAQRSMAGYQGGMNLLNTGLQAVGTIGGMMAKGG